MPRRCTCAGPYECPGCRTGISAAEHEREHGDTTFDDRRDADFEAARVFGGSW